MDQELLEAVQEIPKLESFRVWVRGNQYDKGYWGGKAYKSKYWALDGWERKGEKMYILVHTSSITGTTYEWI